MDNDFKWLMIGLVGIMMASSLVFIFGGDSPARINAEMRMEAVSKGYGVFEEGEFVWKDRSEICEK